MLKKIFPIILIFSLILCGCSDIAQQPQDSQLPEELPSEVIYGPQAKKALSIFAIRPDTMNPLLTKYSVNRSMLSLVFEPLVTTTQNFEINPKLAESYRITDAGVGVVLNLRKGVRWHDGTEFTSADVDYTIKQILEANEECSYFTNLSNIEYSSAIGKYSYEIKLKSPDSGFIHLLDFPIIQKNSAEKLMKNEGITGTGMYKYFSEELYKTLDLYANPDWWGGNINISKISVSLMPDSESSYNSFKMNSIDAAVVDSVSGGKYGVNENIKFVQSNTNMYSFLSLNHGNKLLADVKLRKILKKILCTEKITTDLLPEYSVLCDSPVNPSSVYYRASQTAEIENIKTELASAGYKMDEGGMRTCEIEGNKYLLDFKLLICTDNPVRSIVGEYIKSTLQLYGISVNIAEKTAGEYSEAVRSGRYDMVLCEARIGLNCNYAHLLASDGMINVGRYSSADMDDTLYLQRISSDESDIRINRTKIQQIFEADMPHIPLYFSTKKILYNSAYVKTVVAGDINYEYSNINQWELSGGKENGDA